MNGLKFVLPDMQFTDTSLPILRDDPIMPSAGALLLIDPTHPLSPWAGGVPASIPNLVAGQAAIAGSASLTTMNTATIVNGFSTTAQGIMERTGKGGLHGISSHTADVSGNYGRIVMPVGVSDYIHARPNNDYYVSSWGRITKAGSLATSTVYYFLHGLAVSTSAWNVGVQARSSGNISSQVSADRLGLSASKEADGRYIVSSAVGTRPAGISTKPTVVSRFGPYTGADLHGAPSHILYRLYIEDLTVSGRTWADVNAIDQAEYTKQVKTEGGRYYGDTFTDPATVP